MAKIVNRKVSIGIELNQEEIDALYNILDMFYNEANYKRWAHRLSELRKIIAPYANTDPNSVKSRVMSKNSHDEPPF